jgi:hypothetical protein
VREASGKMRHLHGIQALIIGPRPVISLEASLLLSKSKIGAASIASTVSIELFTSMDLLHRLAASKHCSFGHSCLEID